MNYRFFVTILLMSAAIIDAAESPRYRLPTRLPFNKVIIWGHKLHSHTHSYIHAAFERAFKALGYPTYWLDNNDSTTGMDLSFALFITEGQVDQCIPLRNDSFYILHNCKGDKYAQLFAAKRCIMLQVYTHDCLKTAAEKIAPCVYADRKAAVIYMPWATDLLPHEIDAIQASVDFAAPNKAKNICWIGTICRNSLFENSSVIERFKEAATQRGVSFESHPTAVSMERNRELVNKAYMAPALQGPWQCEKGYIPCRIFKNISNGQLGITNSKAVSDLFEGKIVYNSDAAQLFLDAQKRLETLTRDELFATMDFVKEHHTYITRIEQLLNFFEKLFYADCLSGQKNRLKLEKYPRKISLSRSINASQKSPRIDHSHASTRNLLRGYRFLKNR